MEDSSSKDKVLKSALKEFANFGFEGARTERIAKNAQVNKAMIYYYFKNKEQLYEEIINSLTDKITESVINNLNENNNPESRTIDYLAETVFDFVSSLESDYLRLMMREVAAGGMYFKKIAIPNILAPAREILSKIIEDGIKKDQIKNIDPMFALIHIMGSIIYFNLLKIATDGSEFGEFLFTNEKIGLYKKSMLSMIKSGIEKKGG